MADPLQHPVSRRLALLAGGSVPVVLGTAACTVRSPLEAPPSQPAQPAPVDPDLALRDAAQLAVVTQLALVASTLAARPRLTVRLSALQELHTRHVAALPGAPEREATTVPAGTWASVVRGEQALQQQLAGMAQQADSGGFARLLASMSAAIGQQVAAT